MGISILRSVGKAATKAAKKSKAEKDRSKELKKELDEAALSNLGKSMGLKKDTNQAFDKANKKWWNNSKQKFKHGGKVRGDGICKKGKTKGRMV